MSVHLPFQALLASLAASAGVASSSLPVLPAKWNESAVCAVHLRLQRTSYLAFDPNNFKEALEKKTQRFKGGQEQCAYDFLQSERTDWLLFGLLLPALGLECRCQLSLNVVASCRSLCFCQTPSLTPRALFRAQFCSPFWSTSWIRGRNSCRRCQTRCCRSKATRPSFVRTSTGQSEPACLLFSAVVAWFSSHLVPRP
jgi:hypothetical protein